jgi:AcrR family transcriptional regulator
MSVLRIDTDISVIYGLSMARAPKPTSTSPGALPGAAGRVAAAAETPLARSTASRRGGARLRAGRPRAPAGLTEQRLVQDAYEVFAAKGYVRATVQDIIARTGCSRGAFYLYFRSTDDVFERVVTHVIDELVAATRERRGSTLRERVDAGNRRYLEIFARHRGVMRALAEAAYVNPRIAQLQSQLRSAYLRRVRDHLVRHAAAGRCQPIDPDAATLALGMMVEGAAQAFVVNGFEPFERPLDPDQLCRQITDIWCRAVYLEPDAPMPASAPAPQETR